MASVGRGGGAQAKPLYSLQELQLWSSAQSVHGENVAVPLIAETGVQMLRQLGAASGLTEPSLDSKSLNENAENRPRLLVCHDLQGGYQDDRWLNGGSNAEAYRIWHWRLIDAFVYFSHHLVTIPPASWTDAAHQNGVKVLGTFITEWDEGAAICREILSSSESARRTADQLIAIARHHNFEGWLLNFENEVDLEQIPTLIEFVRYLTKGMHAAMPQGEVIWYDSVTTEGKLEWQDGLTPLNAPFFAPADGLFVNYTWKEQSPTACALGAMHRASDVYMGVDVFGRGTFGGGKYHADAALAAARAARVSAALFAPGWVMENQEEAGANFEHAQERFWGRLQRQWPAARPVVTRLPFQSDFNQGVGRFWYSDGALVSEGPWNHLGRQSLQPLHHHARLRSASGASRLEAKVTFDRAFNGGSAYEIRGPLGKGDSTAVLLFDSSVRVEPAQRLCVSFTVSALPACQVALVLRLQSTEGRVLTVICDSSGTLEERPESGDTGEPSNQEDLRGDTRTAADGTESPGQPQDQAAIDLGKPGNPFGFPQKDLAGQQRESACVDHCSPHSVFWARLKRSDAHVTGWRTLGFALPRGLAAEVTDIGAVCFRSGDCCLLEEGSEVLWEAMERNTEDAWICREREEALAVGAVQSAQEAASAGEFEEVEVGAKERKFDARPVSDGPNDRVGTGSGQVGLTSSTETSGTGLQVGRKMLKERHMAANVSTKETAVQWDSVEGTRGRDVSLDDDDVEHTYCMYIGHVALKLEVPA